MNAPETSPLVSVVIPCYNQGRYLPAAIESVRAQTHRHFEIIVVDDGSTEDIAPVVAQVEGVRYIRQRQAGLSAARNTGVRHSKGRFLVFLDADDTLHPAALETNLKHLLGQPLAAFVSGGHRKVDRAGRILETCCFTVDRHHYQAFLKGNYIGMHAAVMYQRWVFDQFSFDESLLACEDYDLYLKVAREHPVLHHTELIADYLIHDTNMSRDVPLMLDSVLSVLNRQVLENPDEQRSRREGMAVWKAYYCERLGQQLQSLPASQLAGKTRELQTLLRYDPLTLGKVGWVKTNRLVQRWVHAQSATSGNVPAPGTVQLGDLKRTTPFSTEFGYDRGGPVDRFYIERFLEQHKDRIRGRVLEVGDNAYTLRFGGARVARSEVFNVADSTGASTYVGDLSNAPHLPDDAFDCIVLTQTLQLIYRCGDALRTCYRILRPGGVLLLTVPGISQLANDQWGDYWMWSFTRASMERMLGETFPPAAIRVEAFGNVLVATAFLYGMGLPEVEPRALEINDPAYPLLITAIATKP